VASAIYLAFYNNDFGDRILSVQGRPVDCKSMRGSASTGKVIWTMSASLLPGIDISKSSPKEVVDGRDKSGHDGLD
jgi:hypothetical protein